MATFSAPPHPTAVAAGRLADARVPANLADKVADVAAGRPGVSFTPAELAAIVARVAVLLEALLDAGLGDLILEERPA